ncbi:sulfatase-modifying factor [Flavihumibacter solisilvae]|uniref:Sulfatase-modifying factor n=1 Tax=Flavihumibacter solisilvae TaxID=1349421 RepID=A0A0C1LI97_9BACT|nr:sulfatase-modifying factor [Flavihumibacter solisilvae]
MEFVVRRSLLTSATSLVFVSLAFPLFSSAQSSESFKAYKQSIPGSDISFEMVPIPAGDFTPGSPVSEKDRNKDEGPGKTVRLSAFWMASMEVSRDAFDVFYKDDKTSQNSAVDAVTRPSPQYIDFSLGMGKEGGYPVNSLSQYAALMYCRWLYEKTGTFYRLPTELEWEYACRAGASGKYYFGNDEKQLAQYAWYSSNSENKFHKSGQKKPNAWGLYDMLGNVSEWTLDHYNEDALAKLEKGVTDPKPPFSSSRYPKVLKGGGFSDEATTLRCAGRIKSDPSWNRRDPQIPKSKWWLTDAGSVGFRIVRPQQQPTPEAAKAFFEQYLGK